jgi:hypothetical protein
LNKQKIIFQFTDKTLTVYRWSNTGLLTDSVYYLNNDEDLVLFTETVQIWSGFVSYVLLNLSSEEYHEEQLPHIQGKDRKLMLERKLNKLFSGSDYTHYNFLKRQKMGRKDDLFLLSGITDTAAIDPYIDVLTGFQIEISGVYSTPLIINDIIKPLNHASQVLVIATGKPAEDRLPFRQTFLNGSLIHFNRLTSITVSGDPEELAEKFHREIQRTWQYLNNRRELKPEVDLEVILIVPDFVETALKAQPETPHCQYVFVKLKELVNHHHAENKIQQPNFASLTAFLLGNKAHRAPHYKPEKLAFIRRHQQLRRYLLAASIILGVVTLGLTTNNFIKSHQIDQTNQQLRQTLSNNSMEVSTLQGWFEDRHTSPEKMKSVVTTARELTKTNPLPRPIFEIISGGYENFSDLSLNILEWNIISAAENNDKNNFNLSAASNPVLINIEGEVLNFDGNYRRAIERIESFADNIKNHNSIALVTVQKLPLEINSTTNVSRSVAERTAPIFSLDIQLKPGVL